MAKTQQNRLTPTPKALALAAAFGATVPYARVKTASTARKLG